MPVAVAFSPPETFVIHASGDVTYAECQRAVDDILAHRDFDERRKLLVDSRSVTGAPSTGELRAIVRDMRPLFDKKVSVMAVVTDQAFVYGVARMFAVFAESFGLRVRAFRTIEEGESWLAAAGRED